jgi:hypothetical protein
VRADLSEFEMDQSRGLADDLIYGRDLDARPDEVPLGMRPGYEGAAGIKSKGGEYEYVAWSTSNKVCDGGPAKPTDHLRHPMTNPPCASPLNPAEPALRVPSVPG